MDPQAVREARERLGYSIDKTGEEGDLSPNSVLRAEHGEEIRPSTARRLARALNVEVKDLYPKAEASPSPEPPKEAAEEERRLSYLRIPSLQAESMRERWERNIERNTFQYEEWNEAAEVAIEMDAALGDAVPVVLWQRGDELLPSYEWEELARIYVRIGELKSTLQRALRAFQGRFGEAGPPAHVKDINAFRERLNRETPGAHRADEQAHGAG